MEAEAEALRRYGVHLQPDHAKGYKYPPQGSFDISEQMRPWDIPLPIQIGWDQSKVFMSNTAEDWSNPGFLFEVRQGIAYCTFNEPENNNSFSETVSAGLGDATRILRGRQDIRIATLTGNGRMWSAGGDPRGFQAAQRQAGVIGAEAPAPAPAQLEQNYSESKSSPSAAAQPEASPAAAAQLEERYGEYGAGDGDHELYGGLPGPMIVHNEHVMSGKEQNLQGAIQGAAMFYRWATVPQFSVACMNGSAMGGALGLLAGTDFVVAVKSAFAVLSEVRLGVIPAVVSPHVIRAVGTSNAKRIFSIAENLNTQKALEIGLIQRIVTKKDEFPAVIQEIAEKVQAVAPGAVASAKAAIFACLNQPMSERLMNFVTSEYVRVRRDEECEAGMSALAEGRPMPWELKKIDLKP